MPWPYEPGDGLQSSPKPDGFAPGYVCPHIQTAGIFEEESHANDTKTPNQEYFTRD
jgi:hypothetical protein